MTRYRIVQRPCISDPLKIYFDVEKRVMFFFWKYVKLFSSIDAAEEYIKQLIRADKEKSYPKTKIIKEYK